MTERESEINETLHTTYRYWNETAQIQSHRRLYALSCYVDLQISWQLSHWYGRKFERWTDTCVYIQIYIHIHMLHGDLVWTINAISNQKFKPKSIQSQFTHCAQLLVLSRITVLFWFCSAFFYLSFWFDLLVLVQCFFLHTF